jgi:hypothetical protein
MAEGPWGMPECERVVWSPQAEAVLNRLPQERRQRIEEHADALVRDPWVGTEQLGPDRFVRLSRLGVGTDLVVQVRGFLLIVDELRVA